MEHQEQNGIAIAEPLSPVKEASPLAGPSSSSEATTTTTTTTTSSSSPPVSAETSVVEQDDDKDTSMEDVSGEEASEDDDVDDDDDDNEEDEDQDEDEDGLDESFTKDNRCLRCLKSCERRKRADHRRVHRLEGSEGVAVPEANKCTCCVYLGTRCIVAKEPRRKGVNTIRCLKCISNHRSCSFKKTYEHMRASSLRFHPAKLSWS